MREEVTGSNPYGETNRDFYLYSTWHEHLILSAFCGRSPSMAALISRHQDGSYVSETLKKIGVLPVRGSTSRGGAQALRQLLDTVQDRHVVITPDGPRGPRHELKKGIIYLASRSGRKVVPVAHACRRCWRIAGSWTDLVIPKPFTRVWTLTGTPIEVPADLDREGIEQFRLKVQTDMGRLERKLLEIVGKKQGKSAESELLDDSEHVVPEEKPWDIAA